MDVQWRAPLPEGPKILAANHPTTTDPFFILTLLSEQTSVLVTGGAFEVPLFGAYLRRAGHVPVLRDSGGATIREATDLLRSGRTVAIFPEGALSPLEGGIGFHRPRSGVARLALATGAPVIPIGIGLQQERIRTVDVEMEGQTGAGADLQRRPVRRHRGQTAVVRGERGELGVCPAGLRADHAAHREPEPAERAPARARAGHRALARDRPGCVGRCLTEQGNLNIPGNCRSHKPVVACTAWR